MENNIEDYVLHESIVDDLLVQNSILIFDLKNVLHRKNNNQKEFEKINNCKLNIIVQGLENGKEYECIDIKLCYKRRIKIIDFERFSKLLKKRCFKIYMDFYAHFSNAMLLKGTMSPYEIEITISDVIDIFIKK